MDDVKNQIEKLSQEWKTEKENLNNKIKELEEQIKELKNVLFTFEKVCLKIRTKE